MQADRRLGQAYRFSGAGKRTMLGNRRQRAQARKDIDKGLHVVSGV